MNPLDLIAIVMLVLAIVLGIRSGALPQLIGLMGAAVAALAGLAILPSVTGFLDSLPAAATTRSSARPRSSRRSPG